VELWLVRAALVEGELGHLSAEGRRMIRALGSKLKLDEAPVFDRIVASPGPAAIQSAELFADRVDYVGVVEVSPALAAGVPGAVALPMLLARGSVVAVFGDEPALSALGAFLVGRPTFPPLVPAQVSVIRDRQPAWCLRPGDLARQLLLVA